MLVIKKIVLKRKWLSIDVTQSKFKFSKKTANNNKPIKTLDFYVRPKFVPAKISNEMDEFGAKIIFFPKFVLRKPQIRPFQISRY